MSDHHQAGATDGEAFVIDPEKLTAEGWKLVGGVEALNAAEQTIRKIRERSTVVQERMFLKEIADLLRQFAHQHQARLAALAMQTGAGELAGDVPKGEVAN
jgi:hypothetical protein